MSIDFAILAVLGTQQATGYDIKTAFEHEGQGLIWGVSHGSIYTRLRELEKQGMIATSHVEDEGRHRKMYDLTNKGWQALLSWQVESPDYPVVKDDLLLRMAFWLNDEDRPALVQHLQQRRARSQHLLQYFRDWKADENSTFGEYGYMVYEYVCGRLEFELQWIDQSIKRLLGPPQPPLKDPGGLIPAKKKRVQEALQRMRGRQEL